VSGRPAALEAEAGKRGRRGIEGIALSREIFFKRQAIAHPRPTAAETLRDELGTSADVPRPGRQSLM
jgi:hypothetical protein